MLVIQILNSRMFRTQAKFKSFSIYSNQWKNEEFLHFSNKAKYREKQTVGYYVATKMFGESMIKGNTPI